MSIETRLKASFNLLWQISQLIGWFRFSDRDEDCEYVPQVTLSQEQEEIVRRFRAKTETKVRDLSSELEDIIHRFHINNQSMTNEELKTISEELSNKWGVGYIEKVRIPVNPSEALLLSLELFQVMETLLHDFGNSKFLLWRIESIIQNFHLYVYIMYENEFRAFVEESILNLKDTSLLQE
jgi:hypothetical protein